MSRVGISALAAASLLVLGACDLAPSPNAAAAVPTESGVAPTPTAEGAASATAASSAPAAVSALATGSARPALSGAVVAGAPLSVPEAQIYQPSDLAAGERRPLLIFLHGLGASGKTAFDVLHLAAFGARERVFVVAPDGSVDRKRRQFWNAGAACCNFDHRPIDDVARLTQLIETWRARAGVDPSRVYVMGHSNGGFMTERLACALGDRITAAASMAGAAPPLTQACAASKKLALLEVHGDADEIVRYTGGSVFDTNELASFPAIQQGFRDWGKRLGCAGTAQPGPDRDLDPRLAGAETRVERFARCASGSVELWTVRGGNHFVGTGQQAFEAIWQFLSTHHS